MPFGKYPERVGDFRKWASSKVSRGRITDSATGGVRRRRRRRKKRKNGFQD